MRSEAHTFVTMIPCIVVFSLCLTLMTRCYQRSYELLKLKEAGKSDNSGRLFLMP
jgi:hypothetical protein